jgi:hypothetical protein
VTWCAVAAAAPELDALDQLRLLRQLQEWRHVDHGCAKRKGDRDFATHIADRIPENKLADHVGKDLAGRRR